MTLYKDGGERRLAAVLGELLCFGAAEEWLGWADARRRRCLPQPGRDQAPGFDHGGSLARGHRGRHSGHRPVARFCSRAVQAISVRSVAERTSRTR